MPSVEAIQCLKRSKKLREVLILHTENVDQSASPAGILESLCKSLKIPVRKEKVDMHDRLIAELDKLDASWIINGTGGNKLMAYRVYERAKDRAVPIVYREIEEGWHRIDWLNGAALVNEWDVPTGLLADLGLRPHIALALLTSVKQVTLCQIKTADFVEPRRIQQAINRHRWRGTDAMRDADPKFSVSSPGFAFERYIAQALRSQTPNSAMNVQHTNGEQVIFESDVVCLIGKRLFLFDCKLDNQAAQSKDSVV